MGSAVLYNAVWLKHDPEKWEPVFGKRSCSNKKLERDDDSKKSHPALVNFIVVGGIRWTVRAAAPSIRMARDFADSAARHYRSVVPAAAARTPRKRDSAGTVAAT